MSSQQSSYSTSYKEKPQYLHIVVGVFVVIALVFVVQYVLNESVLISLIVFNMIFLLFTFPLGGPLWCKIVWLLIGNIVGILFSLIRLSFTLVLGTDFGGIDFFLNHIIDFLWIVPLWSLALSSLSTLKHRKKSTEVR